MGFTYHKTWGGGYDEPKHAYIILQGLPILKHEAQIMMNLNMNTSYYGVYPS
jgi:hypothetical protein